MWLIIARVITTWSRLFGKLMSGLYLYLYPSAFLLRLAAVRVRSIIELLWNSREYFYLCIYLIFCTTRNIKWFVNSIWLQQLQNWFWFLRQIFMASSSMSKSVSYQSYSLLPVYVENGDFLIQVLYHIVELGSVGRVLYPILFFSFIVVDRPKNVLKSFFLQPSYRLLRVIKF